MKNIVHVLDSEIAQDAAAGRGKMSTAGRRYLGAKTRKSLKRQANKSRRQAVRAHHIDESRRQFGKCGHSGYWD
jgi:hypothetical protein